MRSGDLDLWVAPHTTLSFSSLCSQNLIDEGTSRKKVDNVIPLFLMVVRKPNPSHRRSQPQAKQPIKS
jgi:hypothetical protein